MARALEPRNVASRLAAQPEGPHLSSSGLSLSGDRFSVRGARQLDQAAQLDHDDGSPMFNLLG